MIHAEECLNRARQEVWQFYGATSDDTIVSVDGTWQKHGFSSLFGIVDVIKYNTGKVLDYKVFSKFCQECNVWEKCDEGSVEYFSWKLNHKDINFDGSAGAMEPAGFLQLFQQSLKYNMRFSTFISDGDSKTFSTLSEAQPYGKDHPVEKKDCVGHVQKRLGTALKNLKTTYRGVDGKTIGGKGKLTDKLMDTLQNYYGLAIRNNKGDIRGMMRAVQASLLHNNSTDEVPRHHLCPSGSDSWCKYQKSKALGK